jgi:hypothetical protein
MTRNEQKQRERRFAEFFQNNCTAFPDGTLVDHETPDFLVHSGDAIIGLELCELFSPDSANQRPRIEQESLWERVLWKAKKLWDSRAHPVHVNVSFNTRYPMRPPDTDRLSQFLVETLLNERLPDGGQVHIQPNENNFDSWPPEINYFSAICKHSLGHSSWLLTDASFIPKLDSSYIQTKINKKNNKLMNAAVNCDDLFFLLVASEQGLSSNFDLSDEARSTHYTCEADHVFLLQYGFSKTILRLPVIV